MANKPEIEYINLQVKDGLDYTVTVDAINLGSGLYKLMSNNPISESLIYGAIIRVKEQENVLILDSIVEESNFIMETYFLPQILSESELRSVGEMIKVAGGYWEVMFGGMAWVNLPKDSKLDVELELRKLIQLKKNTYYAVPASSYNSIFEHLKTL